MLPSSTEYLLLGSLWMWSLSQSSDRVSVQDGTVIGNAYFQLLFKAENNPLYASWLLTLSLTALANS